MDYQPLVSSLEAWVTPITLDELYAMLSNFNQRVAQFQNSGGCFKSFANAATRGRGCFPSHSRVSPRSKGKPCNTNSRNAPPPSTNNRGHRGGSTSSRPDPV
ncbi:hypothetical protein D1007_19323 [Hordeum vulgare]|nr:hypothetical protein D1007_19323 [Hordeum vulgare]